MKVEEIVIGESDAGGALTLIEAEVLEDVGLSAPQAPGIIKELRHRRGLNADVLDSGTIAVGDAVELFV